MALIALLGKSQAEAGREFYFIGPLAECKECRLKGVCFNLEPGARYRVVAIRPQEHECTEYDGDSVVAVEVEKIPTPGAVPKKAAIEGSMITYQESRCENLGCANYPLCHATGKREGQKYSIVKLGDDLDCPIGEKMVYADLF